MREVHYATGLDGARIAVAEPTGKIGYEYGGTVYVTRQEAVAAEGAGNQAAYFKGKEGDARRALDEILWKICPPKTWHGDDIDAQRDKNGEFAGDFMETLFPSWGARGPDADDFLKALSEAEAIYREMHA